MTFGVYLDQLSERLKKYVQREFLERRALAQFANYGIASVYPAGLYIARHFWQKSQSFTASSITVNKPTDCMDLLSVTLPSSPTGGAVKADLREWIDIKNNQFQAPVASNPKFYEDKATVELLPLLDPNSANWSGTFHYLRNTSYINDETFELTDANANDLPALPWWLVEDSQIEACRYARFRDKAKQDPAAGVAMFARDYEATMASLRAGKEPSVMYGLTLPDETA